MLEQKPTGQIDVAAARPLPTLIRRVRAHSTFMLSIRLKHAQRDGQVMQQGLIRRRHASHYSADLRCMGPIIQADIPMSLARA
jgi:hypothetical protein